MKDEEDEASLDELTAVIWRANSLLFVTTVEAVFTTKQSGPKSRGEEADDPDHDDGMAWVALGQRSAPCIDAQWAEVHEV